MFGAIAGGIASALAGGAMSKLFGGGQKAASGGIQGDVLATDKDRKSGSAGMPRPISYAVFCLKKKKNPFLPFFTMGPSIYIHSFSLYLFTQPLPFHSLVPAQACLPVAR